MTGQRRVLRKLDLPAASAPLEVQPLRLPAGARIIRVGEQGEDPLLGPRLFIWVEIDPEERGQELRYAVVLDQVQAEREHPVLAQRDWAHKQAVSALGGCMVLHVWISAPVPA